MVKSWPIMYSKGIHHNGVKIFPARKTNNYNRKHSRQKFAVWDLITRIKNSVAKIKHRSYSWEEASSLSRSAQLLRSLLNFPPPQFSLL